MDTPGGGVYELPMCLNRAILCLSRENIVMKA